MKEQVGGKEIFTRVGHAGWDDHRHFGKWVFSELAGNTSTTGLIALAATGRLPDESACGMLDDIAVVLTVADPRIYPLKLVRLASSFGDPLAGLAAAVAAMQGAIVGPQIAQNSALWMAEAAHKLENSIQDDDAIKEVITDLLNERGRLSGFGVPFRKVDERRTALMDRASARGMDGGTYWKLHDRIAYLVGELRGIPANVGLSVAALSLDMGFRPEELTPLYTGLTINVFLANAVEGACQAPEVLRWLPVESIEYVGVPPRNLPGQGHP